MIDINKIAHFFDGWDETLIWSCLHGCMGYAAADNDENPTSAFITTGDICFIAGKPCRELVEKITGSIIVPRSDDWNKVIEDVFKNEVVKHTRYAFKKDPSVFDIEKLTQYAKSLPAEYTLKMYDEELYKMTLSEEWSIDQCSQFKDYNDYKERGIGVAVIYQGKLVAGASSYTVYNGGIEIQIDTKKEFQRKGLATACAAKLILECLKRGLYPSWDAHNLSSVGLAEKLGYKLDYPYLSYVKKDIL